MTTILIFALIREVPAGKLDLAPALEATATGTHCASCLGEGVVMEQMASVR